MNYLESLKNIMKDKKKKRENLVFILILLIVLLISMNYIFSDSKAQKQETVSNEIIETKNSSENIDEVVAINL